MTPTDILAAARANPLSPLVPTRGGWIKDWIGPICFRDGEEAAVHTTLHEGALCRLVLCNDGRTFGYTVTSLCLDLRRPEVRDRLVRCGAPEWCRDSVAGMLGWAIGILDAQLLTPWREVYRHYVDPSVPIANDALVWVRVVFGSRDGAIQTHANDAHGRACADLDSLGSGRILEEPDGWYIPLPGGAVGWLPKESA